MQTKLISDPNELYRFLATTGVEVENLLIASDSVVWASCRYPVEEPVPSLRHTNEVVGVYVACGGHLLLYDYLDQLRE
jgi:hypothetical protein